MTLECYVQRQPQHAHETEALLALAQSMRRAFAASERFYLLAANVCFWRAQADALVPTERAIVLVELKACGDPIYGRAEGAWRTASGQVRGGSYPNPYQQVIATRKVLIKYLDRNCHRFLSGERARHTRGQWGQLAAAIVFSPHLHPHSDIVVPPESRAWLGVIGLNETAEFLFSRFSPHIDLRPQELRRLASEALGCQPWSDLESLLVPVPHYGCVWLLDEGGRRAYAFPIAGQVTIGRSRDNALVVPRRFSHTSRRHACLRLVGDVAWLYDLGSTHGTFVNGEPVPPGPGRALVDGDRISLGAVGHVDACQLRFERQAHHDTATEPTGDEQQVPRRAANS